MRNLTKTLAVLSLLTPSSGYTLGIGDIKLHSALNQNLNAEISLVVSAGEKASDIKVNLAPPDKFDEAGVPWTSLLSKIKFKTIVSANGAVIIKLSSREAVTEPFLDFLLEVSWPKGSLYREFTVLLDPPTAYNQATIPVLTRSESYKPELAVIPQYHQPAQELQTSVERGNISEASEYLIHRNDTLRKIAEQASRQAGVSVEQMMIAMYEENPHAFYEENVHSLLAGKILKIPEGENLLKFSRKQALAEYHRQTKAWKNRLAPVPIETASAKKDTPDNQLTLVAPTDADVTENIIITPDNEQVAARNKVDDAASITIDKGEASVISPVNDELEAKVAELEKRLVMLQQILALKDQQLADLQNQTQSKPSVQQEAVQTTTSRKTEAINPVTQQKPIQPDVKPAIQPEPEAVSNTYIMRVGGVGAGTLSLLGWLWWRNRKLGERTSLSASPSMGKLSESKDFLSATNEKDSAIYADTGGKSSFFSEFTFDDFDADQGEIDPVSEADVYLAYGRYQQAEELLRDVLKDQPDHDECKLKLLEIFYSNENKHAFETYANELAQAGKKDDVQFWAKVTEMGNAICQDSTLFSSETDELSPKDNTTFEKKATNLVKLEDVEKNAVTDIKENNISLSSFEESFDNGAVKEISQPTDNSLDFDLNSYKAEVSDELQNNESIDFDLNTITTKEESNGTLESLVSKTREDAEVNDEFESFDFDFDSNETETSIAKESIENKKLNVNLNNKSSGLHSSFANDSPNKDFYFDKPMSVLQGENFNQHGGLEAFELTDMDELETKLDLAKAYIDMSDTDAAKDMACEVLEKGTIEQKRMAKALLNDLK